MRRVTLGGEVEEGGGWVGGGAEKRNKMEKDQRAKTCKNLTKIHDANK